MNNRHILVLVGILTILSMSVGACAPAPAAVTSPTAAPAQAEAPTAAPAQATGKRVLRVAFSWPAKIDPAVGNDELSSTSLTNLYDSLIFPNAQAGLDPWLAEKWDISADGLTYTFYLRKGAKFHDGSEVKASDVVYSYNRLKTVGEGYAYLVIGKDVAVSAKDDHTVEFKLPQASGVFLGTLIRLYVLNEKLVRQNTLAEGPYGADGDYGRQWLLTHDAGSGPYKVAEHRLEEYLLMQKHTDWWGAFHPKAPDEVRFIGTTEPVTVRALMDGGSLEISDQWEPNEAYQALEKLEGVKILVAPTLLQQYIMMNNRKAPTDDVHCRRAMSYALDYDQVIKLEWPGTKQAQGPVPAVAGGHDPDTLVFKRDMNKAKEELAKCKYAQELDKYPVQYHWNTDVAAQEKWALLFQSNMAELGIKVELTSVPWSVISDEVGRQETTPNIEVINVAMDLPEAGLMLKQRYHTSTTGTWQQAEWILDPELDKAIDDALATVDQKQRFEKYIQLQKRIVDMVPSIFLFNLVEKHAVRDNVEWNPEAESPILGYRIYAAHIGVNP